MLLTQWREHVDDFASALRDRGHDPVILRGGMGTKARAAALDRLNPEPGGPPLLVIATVQYVGEGFDCPALDTLFLAAPIASKGRLVQCVGRILRPTPARPPPRSTTTTTSSPACSPPPSPNERRATAASASQTPGAATAGSVNS